MMMRNIFIGAACSIFMLAGCNSASQQECCCCGTDKEMCVQLYSVRDLIGGSEEYAARHEEVLKALADMGYTGVEAANYGGGEFYGVSPEQFKADVEAAGMEVVSSHVGHGLSDEDLKARDFTKSLAGWDELIAAHKAAGMEYIVCPWMDCDTLDELKFWCEYFNAVGKKVKDAGMKFGYHNHSHEMREIEGKVMIEYMIENTDPELVFYQIDVYWAVYGHYSPADLFNKYPGRFALLHIKDKKEIGQSGMVGFDAVFGNAEVAGMENFVVEVEGCRNEEALEGTRVSAEYLRKAPFVKASYGK